MTRQHNFERIFISGLTTWEYWKCRRCRVTAESNWNDKLNRRENHKINGSKECNTYSIWIFPFVFIKWLIMEKLLRINN